MVAEYGRAFLTTLRERLDARGATAPCAKCGHRHEELEPEFVHLIGLSVLERNGQPLPTKMKCAVTSCARCGHLAFYAADTLGL